MASPLLSDRPAARRQRTAAGLLPALLGIVAAVGGGLALGRVLLSPTWTRAVTAVGLGTVLLAALLHPAVGLWLWVLLAPYDKYLYLKLDLGSGVPDLGVGRLVTLVLLFHLASRVLARRNLTQVTPAGDTGPAGLEAPSLPAFTWADAAMILFAANVAVSVVVSNLGLVNGTQILFDLVIVPMLVYYFARTWLRTRRALLATTGVIAFSSAVLGLITTREQLTGLTVFSPLWYSLAYGQHIRKVLSVFGSALQMCVPLALSIPLLMYGIREVGAHPDRRRALAAQSLLALALLASLSGIFFAYVRAGWLGAVLGIILGVALSPRFRRDVRVVLPLVVGLAVLAVLVSLNLGAVQARLAAEGPIDYRLKSMEIALDILKRSPLLGVGYHNFGEIAAGEYGWNPHNAGKFGDLPVPHNSYLYVLVSGGILALIPYLGIFAALAWRGLAYFRRPESRDLAAVLLATVISYAAMIATYDVLNAQFTNIVFFVIVGAVLGRLEETSPPAVPGPRLSAARLRWPRAGAAGAVRPPEVAP